MCTFIPVFVGVMSRALSAIVLDHVQTMFPCLLYWLLLDSNNWCGYEGHLLASERSKDTIEGVLLV